MAYVAQNDDEEETQNGQAGSEQVLSSGRMATSGGSVAAGAGGGAPSKGGAKGWTNLQSYVTANAGADKGMAQAVDAQNRVAADSISAGTKKFGDDTTAYTQAHTNKDVPKPITVGSSDAKAGGIQVGESNGYASGGAGGIDVGERNDSWQAPKKKFAGAAPKVSSAQVAAAAGQAGGGYTGYGSASEAAGYGETANRVADFQNKTNDALDFNGRTNLLESAFGRPSYTAGEKRLDSFLLGAGDAGRKVMSDIKARGEAAGRGWDDLIASLDTGISNAKTESKAAAERGRSTLEGYRADIEQQISNEDASRRKAIADETAKTGRLKSALASPFPEIRKAAAAELGLDYDLLSQYLQEGGDAGALYTQNDGPSLLDYLDQGTYDVYEQLLGLTGGDGKFDLTSSTGGDGAGHVNADVLAELARKNAEREAAQRQQAKANTLVFGNGVGTTPDLSNKAPSVNVDPYRSVPAQLPATDPYADGAIGIDASAGPSAKPGPDGMEVVDLLKDIATVGQQGASGEGIKEDLDDPLEWLTATGPQKWKFY